MPYCDVVNLVTVTKTNMIHEMCCGCGTLRTTAVVYLFMLCSLLLEYYRI